MIRSCCLLIGKEHHVKTSLDCVRFDHWDPLCAQLELTFFSNSNAIFIALINSSRFMNSHI